MIATCPGLEPFVKPNAWGDISVDFADPAAVKMLNRALLMHFYGIEHWDIPADYLCPPIPGRADYLHHLADLLATSNGYGFAAALGDMVSRQKAGKQFITVEEGAEPLRPQLVNAASDRSIACLSAKGRVLVFGSFHVTAVALRRLNGAA